MPKIIVSTHDLRVIPSCARDQAQILEIAEATQVFSNEEVECIGELFAEYIQRGSASGYQFISCHRGDELLGFCCFGKRESTIGTYDLYWICTDVHSQRGGVGKLLMREAEGLVSKQDGYLIIVETSDKDIYLSARRFYESLGYENAMQVADFYGPNDGIVIYSKYLKSSQVFTNHIDNREGG